MGDTVPELPDEPLKAGEAGAAEAAEAAETGEAAEAAEAAETGAAAEAAEAGEAAEASTVDWAGTAFPLEGPGAALSRVQELVSAPRTPRRCAAPGPLSSAGPAWSRWALRAFGRPPPGSSSGKALLCCQVPLLPRPRRSMRRLRRSAAARKVTPSSLPCRRRRGRGPLSRDRACHPDRRPVCYRSGPGRGLLPPRRVTGGPLREGWVGRRRGAGGVGLGMGLCVPGARPRPGCLARCGGRPACGCV